MDKQQLNPFQRQGGSRWATAGPSLLDYGDGTMSLYNRLSRSQATPAPTQNELTQRILNKYETKLYSLNESGHCLAQSILDDAITQAEQPSQDFWQNRLPKVSRSSFLTQSHAGDYKAGRGQKIRQQVAICQKLVKEHRKNQKDSSPKKGLTLGEMYRSKREAALRQSFQPLETFGNFPVSSDRVSEIIKEELRQNVYFAVPFE